MTTTIVALLTPKGAAALSTFAIVGPNARSVAESLLTRTGRGKVVANSPCYGWFGNAVKDDVVLAFDESGREPIVEICCHGGAAMTEKLIADVVAREVERVDWRTLERRQGRSDFQCDAMERLARASTAKVATILLDQLNGALDRAYAAALVDTRIASDVLRRSNVGRLLERPAKVVLFGLPNAGKSTLLNALVGYSRAITSATPGTTRDVVSEVASLDGWPMELVDGAGFRDDASPLEAEGLRRLEQVFATADLKILVADATGDPTQSLKLAERIAPDFIAANKADLISGEPAGLGDVFCSALTGRGLDELTQRIVESLAPEVPPAGAAVPFLERHRRLFEELLTPTVASVSPR